MNSNFDFESFSYGMTIISFAVIGYIVYIFSNYEVVLFPKLKQID